MILRLTAADLCGGSLLFPRNGETVTDRHGAPYYLVDAHWPHWLGRMAECHGVMLRERCLCFAQ